MDVQTSTHVSDDQPKGWRESAVFKNLEAVRPWLSWLMMGVMGLFMFYQSQRDINAQNAVTLADLQKAQSTVKDEMNRRSNDRDKQVDDLKKQMLTREVFEAYHTSDAQRMERIEKMVEQMLQGQSR